MPLQNDILPDASVGVSPTLFFDIFYDLIAPTLTPVYTEFSPYIKPGIFMPLTALSFFCAISWDF